MATEGVPETDEFPATEVAPKKKVRKPFYKDPLSIIGWGLALASVIAYWFFFVRKDIPKPGEQVARVTAVEGQVRVKPNDLEAWNEAHLQDPLHVGDVVQTEQRSGAAIFFNSGSLVRVRQNSIIYLGGSAEQSTAAWTVESGNVNFSVGDQVTEIVTPTVTTTAERNSTGNIDVGDDGNTGVRIFRGQAEISTSQGDVITLSENEALQVDAQGQAGAKQALPPPPKLLAPEIRATVPFASPPDTTADLLWEAVINGDTYRVALDYNVVQADLLLAATLDVPGIRETRHQLQGLDPGRYFWRVAAVNEAGLEGAFSRVSFFSVEPLPEAAPMDVDEDALDLPSLTLAPVVEVAPGVLHVHGRAEPGSEVTLDGHPVTLMPDGTFSEHVKRTDKAEVTVRATRDGGQFAEQSRPVPRGQ